MSLWLRSFARTTACAMVAVYLALSISSAVCLFTHDSEPRTVHHHGGAAHSSLCVWACQANQSVDLVSTAPKLQPLIFVVLLLSASTTQPSLFARWSVQPRAPPRR